MSPDILTDGHWETVRGVQRWVADVAPVVVVPEFLGQCVECGDAIERAYCRGKCRRCYYAPRRKTDQRRRPSAVTVAEWRELQAHGFSVREAAAAMGLSLSALYAAIKRTNRARERERGAA